MIALCVDDEKLLLDELKWAVSCSPDIDDVYAFEDELDVIEWAGNGRIHIDIAFLDVRLHSMTGIELAEKLREIYPDLPVVFCTGYREYSFDAWQIHASGYLIKPIDSKDIQREIDHIKNYMTSRPQSLLTVRKYGGYGVFDRNGQPLKFKRSKTLELFAVLVERAGTVITTEELCDSLWSDNDRYFEKNKNYLFQLFSDLGKALKDAGAEEVLQRTAGGHMINISLISLESKED